MTCIGFALGLAYMTCTQPLQPAPTGKAPLCQVMRQAGGPKLPSRKDTDESAQYMKRLSAAYKADCK